MASWQDGAEYAPIERPDGFATPRAVPLDSPDPRIDLSAGAPPQRPADFSQPPARVPALAELAPSTGRARDPRAPFETARTLGPAETNWTPDRPFNTDSPVVTGHTDSAWGAAHANRPVVTPAAFAPPSPPTPPTPPAPASGGPVRFFAVVRGATPGLLACLALGALSGVPLDGQLGGLSTLALIVGQALSRRVPVRGEAVRLACNTAVVIVITGTLFGVVLGQDFGLDLWGTMNALSPIACWVLLIVVPVIVWLGLRTGEAGHW